VRRVMRTIGVPWRLTITSPPRRLVDKLREAGLSLADADGVYDRYRTCSA
jgi:hypothetical protein